MWIGLLLLVLGIPGLCAAQTGIVLVVPDDYETIQSAIDAADNNGVVLIRDGVYKGAGNVNLDPGGKQIAIKSENGPAFTIIDCEGTSRGFIFQNSEQATTVITGLTITNGYAEDNGGAMKISFSSPTINNCVLYQNKAEMGGGAIHCEMGSPIISNCEIYENSAISYKGGAIFSDSYSSPTILRCSIRKNYAQYGGGIGCYWMAGPIIRDCTITGNSAEIDGGGIYCEQSYPRIVNSTISKNSASTSAGGGGGIACNGGSNPTIVNCVITNNSAYEGGAILCSNSSSPSITNSTFSDNVAATSSAALHLRNSSTLKITNSILWGDTPVELLKEDESSAEITYCDVQGGVADETCINENPLFFKSLTDDYRLVASSPCVNRGDNSAPDIQATDRDGSIRIREKVVDMGAYELQAVTLDLTVRMANKAGVSLDKVFSGQQMQMLAEFNNFSELEVPFEQLLGRTLLLTFDPPGTDEGSPVSISTAIFEDWRYLVGIGLFHEIPTTTSPGEFTLTGKLSISGVRCNNNEGNLVSSVVANPPIEFVYPFDLPAASKTDPAVNAYRMIGAPVLPSSNDVFNTFKDFFGGGYDPTKWRMSAYDAYYPYMYREIIAAGDDRIDYAKGWWIISSNAKRLKITGSPQRWDDGHYLYPGYQMISCPFWDTSISWQDILLHNPDLGSTSILYHWDGSGNYVSAESMSPGEAYWIWSPVFTVLSLKRDYGSREVAPTKEPASRIIPLRAPAPPGAFAKVEDPEGINRSSTTETAASKVLRQPPPPLPPGGASIKVLSPRAGERVKGGRLYTIRWSSLGISPQGAGGTVRLAYSTNGGKTYRLIGSRVKNTGTYTWRVPNKKVSKRCIVRVSSSLYPSVHGTSKRVFALY
jgi:hypothetical protein